MSGEASSEGTKLWGIAIRLGVEMLAQMFIADALDMKLPAQEDGKDTAVFRADGAQGAIAALGGSQAATDGVQDTMEGRGSPTTASA